MGMKGVFGGLCQATVLGLEDQSEGLGDIRDEEEENNRLYWKKREGYCQLATSGHGCLVTSIMFFFVHCFFFWFVFFS